MDQSNQKKEPILMSGPKFGEQGGWWARFKQNRSNIILSIIGILIIAGGIYLYATYQNSNQPIGSQSTEQNQSNEVTPGQVNINDNQTQNQNQSNQTPSATKAVTLLKAEIVSTDNGNIVVKADKGAGVTHLARTAINNYLDSHQDIKQTITPEHRIYLEDYLTKKAGSLHLKVGQELTFSESMMKDAVDHAAKLNQKQLQNLHKYVLLVPSLQA